MVDRILNPVPVGYFFSEQDVEALCVCIHMYMCLAARFSEKFLFLTLRADFLWPEVPLSLEDDDDDDYYYSVLEFRIFIHLQFLFRFCSSLPLLFFASSFPPALRSGNFHSLCVFTANFV